MKSLASKGIRATGTGRENRTGGAGRLMTDVKTMKKSDRGSFDYRSDGDVHVVIWNDNSIVNVASNHETHEPLHEVGRRVKGASNVKVKQPKMIRSYNKGIGGVDLMDRLVSSYIQAEDLRKEMLLAFVCQLSKPRCRCCLAPSLRGG